MGRADPANAITWKNFSLVSRDPGTAIPGSRLTGLARLSCNREVGNGKRDLGTFVKRNKTQLRLNSAMFSKTTTKSPKISSNDIVVSISIK